MTVLYISHGGARREASNYNRSQRLLFAPPSVSVLLVVARRAEVTLKLPPNVTVIRSPLSSLLGFYIYEAFVLLTAQFRGIDAVATAASAEAIPAWMLRRVGGYRWVCDVWDVPHKHLVTYYSAPGANVIRHAAARLSVRVLRRILRHADLVLLSIHEAGVAGYGVPESRIRAFRNAIALDQPSLHCCGRRSAESFSVCYVSSLFLPDRGLDTLLNAIEALPNEARANVALHLVGDIPAAVRACVEESPVRERVKLHGSLSLEAAHWVMKSSEVGLLPFHLNDDLAYTYPIKLLEYMACGCAVIASDLPGIRRIVRDRKEALLVPPEDIDALCGALQTLLGDDALRNVLRENAKRRVKAFDARCKGERIYAAIAEVCGCAFHARAPLVQNW